MKDNTSIAEITISYLTIKYIKNTLEIFFKNLY